MTISTVTNHLLNAGIVVTANRRLARSLHQHFRQYQIGAGENVWETPLIVPIDAWLIRLHGELLAAGLVDFRLLDQEQSLLIWQQLLNAEKSGSGFLSPLRTATSLASAWRILNEYQGEGLPDFKLGSADLNLFADLQQAYRQELQRLQACDLVSLPSRLESLLPNLPNLPSELPSKPQQAEIQGSLAFDDAPTEEPARGYAHLYSNLLLSGFLRLNNSQTRLLSVINRHSPVKVLPPASNQVLPLVEYLSSVADVSGETKERSDESGSSNGSVSNTQVVYKTTDSDAEKFAVARWCRMLLEQGNAKELPRILVVAFDLQNQRQQILRVFDEVFFPAHTPLEVLQTGRPYDVGMGSPLSDWPLINTALLALELSLTGLSGMDTSAFLTSPYCASGEKELDHRLRFDQQLRLSGIHELTIEKLLSDEQLPLSLKQGLERIRQPRYKKSNASFWCRHFSSVLDALRWPGDSLASHEYQAFQAWQDTLRTYACTASVTSSHSGVAALAALKRLLAARMFQPETGDLPIQIVSPNDSVGLASDYLWVTGMDTANWPGTVAAQPWLPREWQKKQSVPRSSALQVTEDAHLMWQSWQHASSVSVFSYAAEQDEQEMTAAPIVAALPDLHESEQKIAGAAAIKELHVRTNTQLKSQLTLSSIADGSGPALADDAEVGGGTRFFEDQSQCPFRAFVLNRLKGRALEEAGPGIDVRVKGTALHLAMQFFWDEIKTSTKLKAMDEKTLASTIATMVDKAFESHELTDKLHQSPALHALEKERLNKLLFYWLNEHEKMRADFEVIGTEQEAKLERQTLKFKVTVDRIDLLDSGETIVLDYKTGANNNPAGWIRERLHNPQLPLYATVKPDIKALGFAQLARTESRFKGLAESGDLVSGLNPPTAKAAAVIGDVDAEAEGDGDTEAKAQAPDWLQLIDFWTDRSNELASEIKAGVAIVEPQSNACQYCDLPGLCRIDLLRQDAIDLKNAESDDDHSSQSGHYGNGGYSG